MMDETSIKLLIPDLPDADAVLPFLRRIDAARWYSNGGPLVRELEAILAQHLRCELVSACSGTAALELAIAAHALAPGAQVLLPSFTFPATAAAIMRNGLAPLFGDVDAACWHLTPAIARAVAAEHEVALVIPVATFGYPVDVQAWDAFSADTGIPVLVDAASAFGPQRIGKRTAVVFSMHATKPFGIGEGGLFACADPAMADAVRRLANFGFHNAQAMHPGTNGKMSEYAAAVALAQWQRWPALQERRQALWTRYRRVLGARQPMLQEGHGVPANVVLQLPVPAETVARHMALTGIEARRWYCPPLHQHAAYAHCARAHAMPVTDRLATQTLGLPWHTQLADGDLTRIGHELASCLDPAQ